MAQLNPSFFEKTREGERLQDETTPWTNPCNARGLGSSNSQKRPTAWSQTKEQEKSLEECPTPSEARGLYPAGVLVRTLSQNRTDQG
jgi:hypothetical protein